jgi:uncharacterized protein (TIGR03083 family)
VDHATFVDAIRTDGDALGTAARAAGLDASVPSCDGWNVADLLSHQGRLHHWVTGIVKAGGATPTDHWSKLETPGPDAIFRWYEQGVGDLASVLDAAGPDAPAWSWTGDHRAGMWARRMAHETSIHRWDAQLAAGAPQALDHFLAADGVSEVFDVIAYRRGAERVRGNGETIHLHCTDAEGEWLVRLDPDGVHTTKEHAKGDVAARGSASDLFLFVWGRITPDALEVFGDRALLERWQELARF